MATRRARSNGLEDVLIKAYKKRLMDDVAQKQAAAVIHNNVYGGGGGPPPGGGHGIYGQMANGMGGMTPEDYEYLVDIERTNTPTGWKKQVHRHARPKGGMDPMDSDGFEAGHIGNPQKKKNVSR